uniref:Uncharacterized protein n=1 Tax=Glossina brevipalpis TaxID=37001 RepID=A0A1A9WBG1_9MUSC
MYICFNCLWLAGVDSNVDGSATASTTSAIVILVSFLLICICSPMCFTTDCESVQLRREFNAVIAFLLNIATTSMTSKSDFTVKPDAFQDLYVSSPCMSAYDSKHLCFLLLCLLLWANLQKAYEHVDKLIIL